MKRFLAFILSAILLLMSGCSDSEKDPAVVPDQESPIKITVWTYYNGAQLTSFNNMVSLFNETVGKKKGIVVESFSQGSVSDLETNVLNAAEGKVGAENIPNIFAAYADTAYAIDRMGLAADIRSYFTDEELEDYVKSYVEEGSFDSDNEIKIFPCAKSVEIFLLNKTDWQVFADATGAQYSDFSTIEGLTATAQRYYEWTDSLTPDVPNDGKAFYGRDAMANYMLIGSMQLGSEIFSIRNGKMTLNFEKDVVRKLWDNYYIPFIKGYFAASGRFRSDDVQTGNIISFVGSSSGATFFPDEVVLNDVESHEIEMEVFTAPQFAESEGYAVQQGAGMVVTKLTEAEIEASVEFLKWFTDNRQNISFSVNSGYMPVRKSANNIDMISENVDSEITPAMKKILTAGVDTVNNNTLYTPKAFAKGSSARKVLEYAMSDSASEDRAVVRQRLSEGMTLDEATAEFCSEEYFDAWYETVLNKLQAFAD